MKSHKDEVRTANGSVLTMATVYDRGWNEGQKVLVAQSCMTLWHPMDCSLPASSVHRIFQARVLEWVAIPFSRGSSWPRDWTWVSCIASRFLTIWVHRNEGQFSSVAQSCPTLCDPMDCSMPRPPYLSPTPGVYSNSCPSSQWCRPTISYSVVPFSSCIQSFPASEYFQMSQFFTSGGQRIGVSASTSVPPLNTKDSSPLGWTGWISLQPKGLSRVFSNTTVQKHWFFGTQLSL